MEGHGIDRQSRNLPAREPAHKRDRFPSFPTIHSLHDEKSPELEVHLNIWTISLVTAGDMRALVKLDASPPEIGNDFLRTTGNRSLLCRASVSILFYPSARYLVRILDTQDECTTVLPRIQEIVESRP